MPSHPQHSSSPSPAERPATKPAPSPSAENLYSAITRMLEVKEAIAAVSLSHPEECSCTTCRAAEGEEFAFLEVLMAVRDLDAAIEKEVREAQA